MRRPEQDVIDRIDELVDWEMTKSPAAQVHRNQYPLQWLDEQWTPSWWRAVKDLCGIFLYLFGWR
jgi:hypothetical protein